MKFSSMHVIYQNGPKFRNYGVATLGAWPLMPSRHGFCHGQILIETGTYSFYALVLSLSYSDQLNALDECIWSKLRPSPCPLRWYRASAQSEASAMCLRHFPLHLTLHILTQEPHPRKTPQLLVYQSTSEFVDSLNLYCCTIISP